MRCYLLNVLGIIASGVVGAAAVIIAFALFFVLTGLAERSADGWSQMFPPR